MPLIKNKKTGVTYNVTDEELSEIAANPELADKYWLGEDNFPITPAYSFLMKTDYDTLRNMMVNSKLEVGGHGYLITDATTAKIKLIVNAVSANAIGTEAKSPEYPQDVIEYNFDDNVIEWRWDTVADISTAQDLRNLVGLTIGQGSRNVHIGKNHRGIIGENSYSIICGSISDPIGSNSLEIPPSSSAFILGNNALCLVPNGGGGITGITIGDNAYIDASAGGSINMVNLSNSSGLELQNGASAENVEIHQGNELILNSNVNNLVVLSIGYTDLTSATYIYSESGTKKAFVGGDGINYMEFINTNGEEQRVTIES